jgi:hypothetical protein
MLPGCGEEEWYHGIESFVSLNLSKEAKDFYLTGNPDGISC